jgi:hypothetical protein
MRQEYQFNVQYNDDVVELISHPYLKEEIHYALLL